MTEFPKTSPQIALVSVLWEVGNKKSCSFSDQIFSNRFPACPRLAGRVESIDTNVPPVVILFLRSLSLTLSRILTVHNDNQIPIQLGRLFHLSILDLSNNSLTSTIPTQIASLSSLEKLNLSHNQLSGSNTTGFLVLELLNYLRIFLDC